jgi:phosphate starvation-inducible membrane PsiE
VVYVGVGVLLAASALALLVTSAFGFVQSVLNGALAGRVVDLLDQILLVFMIVEILYTVQISFREHALIPEPFLIVGLIAGIRRVLVLTAEFGDLMTKGDATFHNAMLELGLLTVMVLALVWALVLVRRRAPGAAAEKA